MADVLTINWNAIDWTTVIGISLTAYMAGLGTVGLWHKFNEKKRKIRVELNIGLLIGGLQPSPPMLLLSAMNPGNRGVKLNTVGLILPNKKNMFFPIPQSNVTFPYTLPEGERCTVWVEAKQIAQDLKKEGFTGKTKLVGYYTDALNTTYKSKPINFDINEWI